MNRIRYIDGLRGVAVTMVILFHLNIFSQGFAGVELFFAISGYIITFLLLSEFEKNEMINLISFYTRRVSRILPPLIVVILISIILFLNFPIDSIKDKFFQESLFTSIGLTNWYEVIHNTGYWENGVKSPLLHMWSIAIEIQFYMFWPLLVSSALMFQRKIKKEVVGKFFLLLSLLFFIGTAYYSHKTDFNTLYYSTQTRVASFIMGGFFATQSQRISINESRKLLFHAMSYLLCIVLILLTTFFELNSIYLFRGEILLYSFSCGALLFVLHVNYQFNFVQKFLENPLLLYLGKISYSLYLWHLPVIIFFTQKNIQSTFHFTINESLIIIIQIIVSILLASISNKVIEQKFRLNNFKTAAIVLITFPLLVICFSNPKINQNFQFLDSQPSIAKKWQDSKPIVTTGEEPLLVVGDSWSRRLGFGLNLAQQESKNAPYELLIYGVGNSSIMDPDYFLNGQNSEEHVNPYKSFNGYLYYWKQAINQYHPKKVLIVTGYADQATMVVNGIKMRVGSKDFETQYLKQFNKLINFFKDQGITIYMTNIPNNAHTTSESNLNKASNSMNKLFDKVATQFKGSVKILDLREFLSNGNKDLSPQVIENIFMYDESNHPSYNGSKLIGEWLLKNLN